jgi:hypothetical protein
MTAPEIPWYLLRASAAQRGITTKLHGCVFKYPVSYHVYLNNNQISVIRMPHVCFLLVWSLKHLNQNRLDQVNQCTDV